MIRSPEAQKRQADTEAELSGLRQELAELYKNQGLNAQRLLEVMETNKNHEIVMSRQEDE